MVKQQLLQRIVGQVSAGTVSKEELDKMTREQVSAYRKDVMKDYFKGIQNLEQTGVPPKYTAFDMDIVTSFQTRVPQREDLRKMLDEADKAGLLELAKVMPGPMQAIMDDREKQIDLMQEMAQINAQGRNQHYFADLLRKYGDRGLSSNICIPIVATGGLSEGNGGNNPAHRDIQIRVLLGDPEDSEMIMRKHLKKDDVLQPILMDSVISTTDIDNWREQRNHLGEAFLPVASLARIMPVSLNRARHCAERLAEMSQGGTNPVDISAFLLHEAMAQLQLALLGGTEEEMEKSNAPLREAFGGRSEGPRAAEAGAIGDAMNFLMSNVRTNKELTLPSEVGLEVKEGELFKGPLSRAVYTAEVEEKERFTHTANYGNVLLILFAGHDTTGHTMTWTIFELSRHPEVMKELQKEVDQFFEYLDGRDPTYQDLYRLQFMNRCITEAMRLWPVVPTVGWRQLQLPETVKGPGGTEIELPIRTRTAVINWARHRNPDLWGPDVDEFNPHRDFHPEEIVSVGGPSSGANPQSERFSPFAYGPRSCLGKNFAQLEMRLIMAHLLRKFDFTLAGAYEPLMKVRSFPSGMDDLNNFHGLDRGTMGPMDMEETEEKVWGTRHVVGMKVLAKARARAVAGVSA